MSLKIEGCSCVRCKAYLFSEDDIVYCPVCGAPHHRECYEALGHCALEELHGTEREYSREKVLEAEEKLQEIKEEPKNEETNVTCINCGEKYDLNLSRCPKCNAPDFSRVQGFNGFDFLGGVPADYKLDDYVTANDAKHFVATNTHRYIPKFASLSLKKKLSWNWMAFFFPCEWMFGRKMFKSGIIVGILTVIATLLTIPLSLEMQNLSIANAANYSEMILSLMEALPQMSKAAIIFQFLGISLNLAIKAVTAIYGDYIYKNHTLFWVKKIKAESEDMALDYRKRGGVNLLWFLLASLALQYIPMILISLF